MGRMMLMNSQNNKGGMGMAPVYSQTLPGGSKLPMYANPQTPEDFGSLGRAGAYQQDNPMLDWRANDTERTRIMGSNPSNLYSASLGDPLAMLKAKLGGA
jgi:hypothetical protein